MGSSTFSDIFFPAYTADWLKHASWGESSCVTHTPIPTSTTHTPPSGYEDFWLMEGASLQFGRMSLFLLNHSRTFQSGALGPPCSRFEERWPWRRWEKEVHFYQLSFMYINLDPNSTCVFPCFTQFIGLASSYVFISHKGN